MRDEDMDASARLAHILRLFRETHAKKILRVGNDAWEYIDGGSAQRTIVIVPGGGGSSESMFSVNASLEEHARVISLGIPSTVATPEQLVTGIQNILDSLQIEQSFLLGHSLGGMVAQVFCIRHPERVAGLILSNTGIYLGARARILPGVAKLMGRAPSAFVKRRVKSQIDRLVKSVEGADFWRQFFYEELNQPDAGERLKQQFGLMAELVRFLRRNPILRSFSWVQSMPVQIMTSEDDKGFTRAETDFLRSAYQRSQTVTFPKGAGHLSFLSRPMEYLEVVERFITAFDGTNGVKPAERAFPL